MDGYKAYISKLLEMQALYEEQMKINDEINSTSKEMSDLPEIPMDLDAWIDSIPDLEKDSLFKISDFSKMFKVSRKYNKLMEDKEINTQKIKVAVIDNLIERINLLIHKNEE